jgi:hypothetical protein
MSWKTCENVFVIMWRSEKSGCTYSELRKTVEGKNRLVETLLFLGYENVVVTEQKKVWMPEPKKSKLKEKDDGKITKLIIRSSAALPAPRG